MGLAARRPRGSRCPRIVLLVILNSAWFARNAEEAPIIYRPPVDPLARDFVYFFAIAPALLGSLLAGLFNFDHVVRRRRRCAADVGTCRDRGDRRPRSICGASACCARCGRRRCWRPPLAVIATTLFLPWTGAAEVSTSLPADAIARLLRRQFRAAHQSAAARGGRRSATGDLHRDEPRAARICCSTPRRNGRRGSIGREIQPRPAASWSGAPPTPRARRRRDRASAFPASCRKCRAPSNGW